MGRYKLCHLKIITSSGCVIYIVCLRYWYVWNGKMYLHIIMYVTSQSGRELSVSLTSGLWTIEWLMQHKCEWKANYKIIILYSNFSLNKCSHNICIYTTNHLQLLPHVSPHNSHNSPSPPWATKQSFHTALLNVDPPTFQHTSLLTLSPLQPLDHNPSHPTIVQLFLTGSSRLCTHQHHNSPVLSDWLKHAALLNMKVQLFLTGSSRPTNAPTNTHGITSHDNSSALPNWLKQASNDESPCSDPHGRTLVDNHPPLPHDYICSSTQHIAPGYSSWLQGCP